MESSMERSMERMDSLGKANSQAPKVRAIWERPALRRLAANRAEGGAAPCNDGQGVGCGPPGNHS